MTVLEIGRVGSCHQADCSASPRPSPPNAPPLLLRPLSRGEVRRRVSLSPILNWGGVHLMVSEERGRG